MIASEVSPVASDSRALEIRVEISRTTSVARGLFRFATAREDNHRSATGWSPAHDLTLGLLGGILPIGYLTEELNGDRNRAAGQDVRGPRGPPAAGHPGASRGGGGLRYGACG